MSDILTLEKEIVDSVLNRLIYAITSFEKRRVSRRDIFISMPNYLLDYIYSQNRNNSPANFPEEYDLLKQKVFGTKIIPAAENKITVFHKQSPLYDHLKPIIILIK